ncbi:MAG: hypothetical protein AAGC60_14190 [Acidobacteriota bacterium]
MAWRCAAAWLIDVAGGYLLRVTFTDNLAFAGVAATSAALTVQANVAKAGTGSGGSGPCPVAVSSWKTIRTRTPTRLGSI